QLPLQHNFKAPMTTKINGLTSKGDTNIQEGLRVARSELTANGREVSAKVVVFFTDGRATAMRGTFQSNDRIAAVGFYTAGTPVTRGYFNNPDQMSAQMATIGDFYTGSGGNWPGGCSNTQSSCGGMPIPSTILTNAANAGLTQANLLRQDGVLVYSIGLG